MKERSKGFDGWIDTCFQSTAVAVLSSIPLTTTLKKITMTFIVNLHIIIIISNITFNCRYMDGRYIIIIFYYRLDGRYIIIICNFRLDGRYIIIICNFTYDSTIISSS